MVLGVRLEPIEREAIKEIVARRDPSARVFLFGSRTRPDARGGDIDLLIASEKLARGDLRQIKLDLQDRLGMQHFDLVVLGMQPSAFVRAIAEEAIAL
jgi:predicted nucleotidyltransferase